MRPLAVLHVAGPRRVLMAVLLVALLWAAWPATHGGRLGMVVVSGNSMRPTYAPGDVLLSWPAAFDVGDPVLLRVPPGQPAAGTLVIHRIHDRDTKGWITRGDNSAAVDVWRLDDEAVLGRVVVRLPGVGALLRAMRDPLVLGLIAGALCLSAAWPPRLRGDPGRWADVSLAPTCPCEDTCASPGPDLSPVDDRILVDALAAPAPAPTRYDPSLRGSVPRGRRHVRREATLVRSLRRQLRHDRCQVLGRAVRSRLRRRLEPTAGERPWRLRPTADQLAQRPAGAGGGLG